LQQARWGPARSLELQQARWGPARSLELQQARPGGAQRARWSSWARWGPARSLELQQAREQLARTVAKWGQISLAAAFAGWAHSCLERRPLRRTARKALLRLSQRHLAQAFTAWQDSAASLKHLRELAKTLMQHFLLRTEAAAFRGWCQSWSSAKQKVLLLRHTVAFWQQRRYFKVLCHWRAFAEQRRRHVDLGLRAVLLWCNRSAGSALLCWREYAERHAALTQCKTRVASKRVHAQLAAIFAMWRAVAKRDRRRAAIVVKMMRRYTRHLKVSTFYAWENACDDVQQLALMAGQHAVKVVDQDLRRMLQGWCSLVRQLQSHRERVVLGITNWMRRTALTSFRDWRTLFQHRHHLRMTVMRCGRMQRKLQQRGAWESWALLLAISEEKAARLHRAKRQITKHAKSRAVKWWSHYSWRCRSLRDISRQVKRRGRYCAVLTALSSWVLVVQHSSTCRQLADSHRREVARLLLGRILLQWRDLAKEMAQYKRMVLRENGRHARRIWCLALQIWRNLTARRRQIRLEVLRLVSGRAQVAVAAALTHWRKHSQRLTFLQLPWEHVLHLQLRATARSVLRARFSTWTVRALYVRNSECRINLLLARWGLLRAVHMWRHWQACALGRRRLRVVSARLQALWDARLLASTMLLFVRQRVTKQRKRRMLQRAVKLWNLRAETRVKKLLPRWRSLAQRACMAAKFMRVLEPKLRLKLLAQTWAAWREEKREGKQLDKTALLCRRVGRIYLYGMFRSWKLLTLTVRKCQMLLPRLTLGRSIRVLRTWRLRTARVRLLRRTAMRLQQYCGSRLQANVLATWGLTTLLKKRCKTLYSRHCCTRRSVCLEGSMHIWKLLYRRQTLNKRRRAKLATLWTRRVFAKWKDDWAAHKQGILKAASCWRSTCRRTRLQWYLDAFSCWKELHHKAVMDRCMVCKHGRRTAKRHLQNAFTAMVHFVEELNRSREHLKHCLRTKRITMQWFMNFYWDAYECDIRHSLEMLTGTCDNAMGELFQGSLPMGLRKSIINHSEVFAEGEGPSMVAREAWGSVVRELRPILDLKYHESNAELGGVSESVPEMRALPASQRLQAGGAAHRYVDEVSGSISLETSDGNNRTVERIVETTKVMTREMSKMRHSRH
ncbi:hypothetical protein CYMTET_52602, partial [Cymbomonas tetramitiformis]